MSKWVMWAHFRYICFNSFSMIKKIPRSIRFWPLKLLFEHLRVHRDSNSQCGSSLGNVRVYSLTFFCTPRSMWHDSRTSLLATTLQPPCLGCEPKATVTKIIILTKKIHLLTFFFFKRMVIKMLLNNYIQFNFFQMILNFQKQINVITYIIEFFYKVNSNYFIWTKFQ